MSYIPTPLPFQIANGQIEDAAPVMGNFNYIAAQVNQNIPQVSGSNTNTYWGFGALGVATPNSSNTAFGYNAGASITGITTNGNVAVGYLALVMLTNNGPNTAIGETAMQLATGCRYCTAVGAGALNTVTGNENTAVGSGTGQSVTSGADNTLLGYLAGAVPALGISTGSNNTLLGANTKVSSAAAANRTVVGANAQCDVDNTVQLGSSAVTSVTVGANGGATLGTAAKSLKGIYLDYSNPGTVGDVVINKPTGRIVLGSGTTTFTVTNSLVTPASHIFLQVITVQNGVTNVYGVGAGAGSFTVTAANAPGVNIAMNFLVVNAD